MSDEQRRVRQLDARSLRGLAHPMRVELLGLLRLHGPATATGLADRLGERSGTTSWHLRQLAEHGFIEEVPDKGSGRERWWRAAQEGTLLTEATMAGADPETRAAYDIYMHQVLDLNFRAATRYLTEDQTWSQDWRRAATVSDWRLSLSAEEANELLQRLEALVESYRREGRDGDEQYVVQTQTFPRRSS